MARAQLLGAARRMERVAHEHQPGRRQAFSHSHRAHPPTHRAAAQEHHLRTGTGLGSQIARLGHHGRHQDLRLIGRLSSGQAVREVHAAHAAAQARGDLVDGHQGALPAPGA